MIKVEKSIDNIPDILNDERTQRRRKLLLSAKKWPSKKKLKSAHTYPYSKELKQTLKSIYNDKCAYCEQKMVFPKNNQNKSASNDLTLEHYRPKSIYYWLAYSWDNLLPVCNDCNQNKKNDFDIEGIKTTAIREHEIDNIHQLVASYNQEELPKFIHPELEDFSSEFIYKTDGTVYSENHRCQYVIVRCKQKINPFHFHYICAIMK